MTSIATWHADVLNTIHIPRLLGYFHLMINLRLGVFSLLSKKVIKVKRQDGLIVYQSDYNICSLGYACN